jgi:hypothetical protein
MSQQEFDPESQAQEHDPLHDELYYPHYPYSWSGKLDNEATPRDEPPSSYDEPIYQQGYQAQTNPGQNDAGYLNQQGSGTNPINQGRQQQGQGVPPWARPQQHRRAPFRFGFILLILVALALIQGLIANGGSFVGAAGDIFGAIFGLLLLVLLVPLIILAVFFRFFLQMSRFGGPWYGRRQRWRGRSWPRGPYWW